MGVALPPSCSSTIVYDFIDDVMQFSVRRCLGRIGC
jgi:hypothetical protein